MTSSNTAPVFLFGFDRSGTTLLSLMMGAHPDLAIPFSTTDMWYRFYRCLHEYGELTSPQAVRRLVQDIAADDRIGLWDVNIDVDALVDQVIPGSYPSVIEAFHSAYARLKQKPLWGNISISTIKYMPLVNEWFSNARFVHIVRDCRDVAVSHQSYRYGADNVFDCSHKWLSNVGCNLQMGRILGNRRYHVIRYEDLVLNSEQAMRDLCGFLSIRYSEQMLDHVSAGYKKIPSEKKFLWPKIDKPLDPAKVGRWKTGLSQVQCRIVEAHTGELLRELGYDVDESIGWNASALIADIFYYAGRDGRWRRIRDRLSLKSKTSASPTGSRKL